MNQLKLYEKSKSILSNLHLQTLSKNLKVYNYEGRVEIEFRRETKVFKILK